MATNPGLMEKSFNQPAGSTTSCQPAVRLRRSSSRTPASLDKEDQSSSADGARLRLSKERDELIDQTEQLLEDPEQKNLSRTL